ncbi:hypothetical protein AB0903_25440 [Streptomyces sp. NPDC048389]|uniref:hypothetical protein n=1 Tax=Streptomyces sp. NPDC048389 TaxID=3154622 RepID=UPI003452F0F4
MPDDLCFANEAMVLRGVFPTAERLAEDGHGSRPDLTTGTGHSISVDSYVNSGTAAGCRVLTAGQPLTFRCVR